jgi:4-amino-4-deoxy-L-arabinose transferase-like glycosyltransferase
MLWAAVVLGTGLALRLIFAFAFGSRIPHAPYFFPPRVPHQPSEVEVLKTGASLSDSHAYEKTATNLLDHGAYTWQEEPPYRPSTYLPPGYPGFIAAVYGTAGRNPWNVAGVQIFLSLLMIGLCFFYCERRWGIKVAVPASLLLAFDPVSVGFSATLMGETLGAAVFLGAMLIFLEVLHKPRWWKYLLAGSLLAVAALVRAAVLYFVILLILPLLLSRKIRFRSRLIFTGLLLAGFAIPVGGWMLRNKIISGRLHFTAITGYNLLYTNAGSLVAWQENVSLSESRVMIAERYADRIEAAGTDPVLLSRQDARLARDIILASPEKYALLHAAGGLTTLIATRSEDLAGIITGNKTESVASPFRLLFSHGPGQAFRTLKQRGWLSILSLIEVLVLLGCYVFCFIGIIRYRWRPDWLAVFLLVAYTAALVGPVADSRFRIVFMPLVYIYAVRGLFSLREKTGLTQVDSSR